MQYFLYDDTIKQMSPAEGTKDPHIFRSYKTCILQISCNFKRLRL